jgi:hypothetical protein
MYNFQLAGAGRVIPVRVPGIEDPLIKYFRIAPADGFRNWV